ncbi:MAG: sugar ABC transporter substrate-binding protein [Mesorhizobium sp.]|nr:sugar ABC transporter substrate-binding protein [Mesorhizobium sp.]MBL8577603.1 sugar ABC transporter substrate-binding protein [Mesorhizobium sp.]
MIINFKHAYLALALAPVFPASAGAADLSGKHVMLVTCGPSNPWCKTFNERITGLLKETGVKITVLENDLDPIQVNQQMAQAVSQKPDLIMVEPADDKSLIAAVKKAKAAAVPVLYMDSPADEAIMDDIALQVVADNYALGKFAGENIVEGLKAQGRTEANVIAITGSAGTAMVSERQRGFMDAMAQEPAYKVVEVQANNWDPVESGRMAQQLFAKYASLGGIQGVRADADYMAIPILEAARQAGLKLGGKDGLIVSGSTCSPEGIAAIKAGDMIGTATADPWTQGEASAQAAIRFLSGEAVEKTVKVPEFRVTAANVDQYGEVCAK